MNTILNAISMLSKIVSCNFVSLNLKIYKSYLIALLVAENLD